MEQTLTIALYCAMAILVVILAMGIINLVRSDPEQASRSNKLMRLRVIVQAVAIALLVGVGITGTAGIWFITKAYAAADMSAVVPFDFLRLPIVGVAGWLLFNEPTDIWTVFGAIVIFASTYALARNEARPRS